MPQPLDNGPPKRRARVMPVLACICGTCSPLIAIGVSLALSWVHLQDLAGMAVLLVPIGVIFFTTFALVCIPDDASRSENSLVNAGCLGAVGWLAALMIVAWLASWYGLH